MADDEVVFNRGDRHARLQLRPELDYRRYRRNSLGARSQTDSMTINPLTPTSFSGPNSLSEPYVDIVWREALSRLGDPHRAQLRIKFNL